MIQKDLSNYYIHVLDKITGKQWCEYFDSYYIFRKRYYKLLHSKKLHMLDHSNINERG